MTLGLDTRLTLLAAGLIFLLALLLGVWKYRQMATSPDHLAHPYVDIAHRSALMYSFATLLVSGFVELSDWPTAVNATCAGILVFFFVAAIGSSETTIPIIRIATIDTARMNGLAVVREGSSTGACSSLIPASFACPHPRRAPGSHTTRGTNLVCGPSTSSAVPAVRRPPDHEVRAVVGF